MPANRRNYFLRNCGPAAGCTGHHFAIGSLDNDLITVGL